MTKYDCLKKITAFSRCRYASANIYFLRKRRFSPKAYVVCGYSLARFAVPLEFFIANRIEAS